MDQLTKDVLEYQRTGRNRDALLHALDLMVYTFLEGRRGFDEDDKGEFLLHVHPRIQSMLDRFEYTGTTFTGYFRTTLHYQARSYAKEKHLKRYDLDARCHIGIAREAEGCSIDDVPENRSTGSVEYHAAPEEDLLCAEGDGGVMKRRLLIIALANLHRLEDRDIVTLCERTGHDIGFVRSCVYRLHELMEGRFERRERLRLRRNNAFSSMLRASRAASTSDHREYRELHVARYERQRRVFQNACKELYRMKIAPKHSEIAMVLGIPKGTIDSCLHKMRKKAEETNDFTQLLDPSRNDTFSR